MVYHIRYFAQSNASTQLYYLLSFFSELHTTLEVGASWVEQTNGY